MKMLIMLFLLPCVSLYADKTVFDKIEWQRENSIKDVDLYYKVENGNTFFKAEIIIDDIPPEIIADSLMNFKEYDKVFPKTDAFNPVRIDGDEKYIVYMKLDFFPMKKRDGFIDMSVKRNDEGITLVWTASDEFNADNLTSDSVRAERINGRWFVKKTDDGRVKVSVEYSNDWKIRNVPESFLVNIQKGTTADALRNLLKYARGSL